MPKTKTYTKKSDQGKAWNRSKGSGYKVSKIETRETVLIVCEGQTEKVYFEYPLEPFQLKAIKDNPYGRIVVDGEICYLSELEYQYKDGIAKFTVIPQI